jgi:chromosome segregation ATPase
MIHRREATQRSQLEETEDMTLEVRVARIESHVEHIQSDVSDIKLDVRELRQGTQSLSTDLASAKSELRAEITALALAMEKLRGPMRVGFTAVIVIQLVAMGGAASVMARVLGLL